MEIDEVYKRQVIAIRKGINSSNNQAVTLQTSQSSKDNLFNLNDLNLKTGSI
jgi:hypothetical protein